VAHPYKVDLIPFGGIETSPGIIMWPPDMAIMMNVAGFGDALAAAVNVEVSPGMEIKVASLPGIAILKIFAWADRGHQNPKEANALAALEAVGYPFLRAGTGQAPERVAPYQGTHLGDGNGVQLRQAFR
jgi:predicted nucleotidyltransferase